MVNSKMMIDVTQLRVTSFGQMKCMEKEISPKMEMVLNLVEREEMDFNDHEMLLLKRAINYGYVI